MNQRAAVDPGCNQYELARGVELGRWQQQRLEEAVIETVQRKGFVNLTVADVVASAEVSRATLYRIFGSREQCFLATFDKTAREAMLSIGAAYRRESDPVMQLTASVERLAQLVAKQPPAASLLLLIDSLVLGQQGAERRAQLCSSFENLFGQFFLASSGASRDSNGSVGPRLAARVFVGGLRRVTYGHVRRGEAKRLPDRVDELVQWARACSSFSLHSPSPEFGKPVDSTNAGFAVPWNVPPNSMRSRAKLSQRERIVRATAQLAAADGVSSLAIPAISAAAGTSNQTFYQQFENKEAAFLAAFTELSRRADRISARAAAIEGDGWRERGGAYMRALLSHVAAEPLFARVAFIEMPAAGPEAIDRADEVTSLFTQFLKAIGFPEQARPLEGLLVEAVDGGLNGVIQHDVAAGDLASLPGKAEALTEIALAPLAVAQSQVPGRS